MLVIAALTLDLIRTHLEIAYPEEGCGLLIGTHDESDGGTRTVRRIKPVQNAAGPAARARYLVAPDDYVRIDREARENGLDIVGVYHSHPDHPAAPSATDAAEAWPNLAYLIVPVARGLAGPARVWRLAPNGAQFEEDALELEA